MANDPTKISLEVELDQSSATTAAQQATQAVTKGTQGAEEKAAAAAERRLKAIERQNAALKVQYGLLRDAGRYGNNVGTQAASRSRASAIRAGDIPTADGALSAALRQRENLAASLAQLQAQIRRQQQEITARARQLQGGQAGFFGAGVTPVATSLGRVFGDQSRGFIALRQRNSQRLQSGFGNLFGAATGPATRVANKLGTDYDGLAAAASRAGLSLQDFIRHKTGATAAEKRNEAQLKSLNKVTDDFTTKQTKSSGALAHVGRVLRSLITAFVAFRALQAFNRARSEAIDYVKTLQNVRLGLAEILLVGNRFRDKITGAILPIGEQVKRAFGLAERATQSLINRAIEFGLPIDTLVSAFQTVGGIAQSSGVKFEDTLDIITQIGVVAQRLNIPFNQLTRSIDNIFTGLRVQSTQLGVILGLNQKIVQQQIQQGTLGGFLKERLAGVAATLPENLGTLEGITQSLRSITLDLFSKATSGGFAVLQENLKGVRDRLLEIRNNPKLIAEYADKFTDFAKSVAEATKNLIAFTTQNSRLLGGIAGAAIGGKYGGAPGALAGAAAGSGLVNPTTALGALAIGPLAKLIGRVGALRGVQGAAGLTGGAAVASRLSTVFPGLATGLSRLGGAVAIATNPLTLFAAGLGGAIYVLKRFVDELNNKGPENYKPRKRSFTSTQERLATDLFGEVGRVGEQLTPEGIAELQRLALGRNPRNRQLAQARLQGLRNSTSRIQSEIPNVTDPQRAERLQAAVDYYDSKLTELEAADPSARIINGLTALLKGDEETLQLRNKQLSLTRAQNDLAVQQAGAQQKLLEVERDRIDLQEQSLRGANDLADSLSRLQFAQTSGRARAGLSAQQTVAESQLGVIDRLGGLAQSRGDYGGANNLDAERNRIQDEINNLQRGQQAINQREAERELESAQSRVALEQRVSDDILPRRLQIEREILKVQLTQANVKAAGAAEETAAAEEILTTLEARSRQVEAQAKVLKALQGDQFDATKFLSLQTDLETKQAEFKIKKIQAEGNAAAAAGEAQIARKQLGLQDDRDRIALSSQEQKIADAKINSADASNKITEGLAEQTAFGNQIKAQELERIERFRQLSAEQSQFIGNTKQFLSDILQADDKFSSIVKRYGSSLARNLTDNLSNTLVNYGQDKVSGKAGGFDDLFGRIKSSFGGQSTDAQTAQSTAQSALIASKAGPTSAARIATGRAFLNSGVTGTASGVSNAAGATTGASGAAAGGAAAGAAAASGYVAAAIAALGSIVGAIDADRKERKSLKVTAESISAARNYGVASSGFSAVGFGGIGKLSGKFANLFPDKSVAQRAVSGAAAGTILGPIGSIVFAILGALAKPPTAGSIQSRLLAPALAEAGFTKDARFGPGKFNVYTAFRGANARAGGLPASYAGQQGAFAGFGQAGKITFRGKTTGSAFNTLNDAISASVQGAAADLGLSAEDAFALGKGVTKNLTESFTSGSTRLLAQKKRGKLTQEQLASGLGGLITTYGDLTAAIDGASLAVAAFGKNGEVNLKALERAGAAAKAVVVDGVGAALKVAVQQGSPYEAGQTLAKSFADSFLNEVQARLVNSTILGSSLSKAVALATQAADALVQGDTARYNTLIKQATSAYQVGAGAALTTINALAGPIGAFNSSIGVYSSGTGIYNPTGQGVSQYATPNAVRVPGPAGRPRLAVVHGDEVIRDGAHNDALVGAMNRVAEAQRELTAIMSRNAGVNVVVPVTIDGEVVATGRGGTKRRGNGAGIKVPDITVGVA